MEEFFVLLALFLLAIAIVLPILAIVLVVVLWRRVTRLTASIELLKSQTPVTPNELRDESPETLELAADSPVLADLATPQEEGGIVAAPVGRQDSIDWEMAIGRRALGWGSVVLVLIGASFFLKYAYDNQWTGPVGRIGVGLIAGVASMLMGWRYHRRQWRVFAQMFSAGGIVVLLLSVYSSFGFYQLVPGQVASAVMVIVIVEASVLAILYRAPSLAWMSLLGGLLIPVLMASDTDQYQSLFAYLAALNVGIVVLAGFRNWAGLATAGLLGTQGLFWSWYYVNYHPEKLLWAIGFQVVLFVLFLTQSGVAHVLHRRRARWDDLVRILLTAFLWFAAAFILLRPDYRPWMGLLAVTMATIYVGATRVALWRKPDDTRQILTWLTVAVSFIALAFPIQADAEWVALAWAAEGAVLIWFGLLARAPAMRAMSIAVMTLAVVRLLFFDTPAREFANTLPIFNLYALPAIGVCLCLLFIAVAEKRFWTQLAWGERILAGLAGMVGVLLLLFVLSVDLHGYFRHLALEYPEDATRWRWMGQMALSALWAVYAVLVLAVGFIRRSAAIRWTALLLFAVTTGKVLIVDMAGLREFYRILAFFIVAILLGAAAWAYQRVPFGQRPAEAETDESI